MGQAVIGALAGQLAGEAPGSGGGRARCLDSRAGLAGFGVADESTAYGGVHSGRPGRASSGC